MDNFTYFHFCNHRIQKVPTEGEVVELTVYSGEKPIDIVINDAIVLEIIEVRAIQYDPNDVIIKDFQYDNKLREQTYDDVDPGEAYYDEPELYLVDYSKYFPRDGNISEPLPASFYEPTLHNRIKWLVKPPTKYQVKARVRYTHISYTTYTAAECPICGGKGWFVDILDKEGKFKAPSGIEKIAQRVVKDLLTQMGTQIFDTAYGTHIKKDVVLNSADDERIFDMVRLAVSDAEDMYLTDQQEMIADISEEEILTSLVTEDVFRSSNNPTMIIVQIRIVTQTEERVFRIGF